jgi:hypothetical protein
MRPDRAAPILRALIPALLLLAAAAAAAATPAKRAATSTASAAPAKRPAPPKPDYLPDSHVLATVGERKITIYDFRYYYFLSDATLRPSPDSLGRAQFLHDLIDKEILGQAALQTKYEFSFADRADYRDARNAILANALFRTTVDATPIPEDSLRRIASYYARDLRLRLLYFTNREQAEGIRHELISGRLPWAVAQARYGLHSTTVVNGLSDWIKFQNLPLEVALPIWGMRVAQVSPVIPASSGYHVVQVADERPGRGMAYVGIRATLRRQLRDIIGHQRRLAIQAEAKKDMGVVYDTTNVRWASSIFHATTKVESEGLGSNVTIDPNLPEFAPADTSRRLVTWKGGRLSVGDILHDYSDLNPLTRPSLNTPENLFAYVDAVMLSPKMTQIALDRGLDKDSVVVRQLEFRREGMLVSHLVEDSALTHVSVSKEERQQYYEQHHDAFITYARVRFGALVRASRGATDSTIALLRKGASFDSLLAIDKARGVAGSDSSEIGTNESNPNHKILFEELRPGKATSIGPDKQGLFAVLYEKSYDPGHMMPFSEVEGSIDESVRNIKGDQAVRALIERLSSRFPAVVHYEDVMRLPLTDPTIGNE